MRIRGLTTLTPEQLEREIAGGARFIHFEYCVSLVIVTWRRATDIYLLRPDDSRFLVSLPWNLLTLFLGWWGIPWGLLGTPAALVTNFAGGRDVTPEVVAFLHERLAPNDPV